MAHYNINQGVKVKLTEMGLLILKQQHDDLYNHANIAHEYVEPNIDKDGYSLFTMHSLMYRFGVYLTMGCDIPFEPDIILVECK